eukprot:gene16640-19770_t
MISKLFESFLGAPKKDKEDTLVHNIVPPVERVIKIIILGGYQVGKSSLVRRYLQECFTNSYLQTIGTDLSTMILQPLPAAGENEPTYLVQFCDVAHAEIKGKHISNIFNGVSGIIMMFDSTNANSIVAIDEWRAVLKRSIDINYKIPIALFANKSDIGDPVITIADLDHYCKKCGYNLWKFTSAKRDIGVKDGIDKLLELIIDIKKHEVEAARTRSPAIELDRSTSGNRHRLKKDKLVSQSMPSLALNSPAIQSPMAASPRDGSGGATADNGGGGSTKKQESNGETSPATRSKTIQPSDALKINELQKLATDHYTKVQKNLDDLLQQSSGARYKDISMLEKQRSHEYVKICNCLKKLLQPNITAHQLSGGGKLSKEMIHSSLDESIKKWNTLIENLQLESVWAYCNGSNISEWAEM